MRPRAVGAKKASKPSSSQQCLLGTLSLPARGHLGLRAGQGSLHGPRPLLLPSQRTGWSGSVPAPLGGGAYSHQPLGGDPPISDVSAPTPCPGQGCAPGLQATPGPSDLPRACLTLMGSVAAELSPTPASLTDLTQNSYSLPVLSPGTVNLGENYATFRDGRTARRHS